MIAVDSMDAQMFACDSEVVAENDATSDWTRLRTAICKANLNISGIETEDPTTDPQITEYDDLISAAMALDETFYPEVRSFAELLPTGSDQLLLAHIIFNEVPTTLIQSALELGNVLEKRGYVRSAKWIVQRLYEGYPEFYWPAFALARMALAENNTSAACLLLERAITNNPNFGWSHFLMYQAQKFQGQIDKAAEHLNRAIELIPEIRKRTALDRLLFCPSLQWTVEMDGALTDLIESGPLPDSAIDKMTAVAVETLRYSSYAGDSVSLCIRGVERLFFNSQNSSYDIRSLPLLYVAALMCVPEEYSLGEKLLFEFERRLPESFDAKTLSGSLSAIIYTSTDIFLKSIYISDRSCSIDQGRFCVAVADIHYYKFHNAGIARMLLETVRHDLPRESKKVVDSLRLASYAAEMKWFEVISIAAACTNEDLVGSPQLFSSYLRAIFSVADGSPMLMLKAVRQALSLVRGAECPWEVMDGIVDKHHGILSAALSQIYAQMKGAATGIDRNCALAIWESAHADICDMIEQCEELRHAGEPKARGMSMASEILVLTSPYLPQVLHYRGEQTSALLDSLGIPAALIDLTRTSITSLQMRALASRAVILQRQPATFEVVQFIGWCKQIKIPIIFDIDDQIFDSSISPLPFDDYAGRISRDVHIHLQFDCSYFRQAMDRCDAIIVSTEPLRRQVEAILSSPKPIYVRRNMIGEPLSVARFESLETRKSRNMDGLVEIFYGSGTKAHKAYFDQVVLPALIRVARERGNTRITLLGEFDLSGLPTDLEAQFENYAQALKYNEYLARLAKSDISISPLNINQVTDAKSELKWFEAASVGVASVVSPTANYRDVVEEGRHVLFAETCDQWYQALVRLVDSPELRLDLVESSARLIEKHYEITHVGEALLREISHLVALADTKSVATRRSRVLVVNTYFRPQSIGGATRIAEAYALDLANRYGDKFEVFALCADSLHRSDPPYKLSVLRQQNVTVIRCAIPMRDWADPIDARVEALATQIARELNIDVVHAHSVQILTASVLEGFLKVGVPVLLSLHDAWWLSEHQFLVDDNGKAFSPRADHSDLYETECKRMSDSVRMQRRVQLRRVLRRCARRLAVSESFAEVYRHAGISKVEVLENGVTLPQVRRNRPSSTIKSGRLRIGFIGGLSAHKGLALLEDVVRSENLENLEFVLVDHRFDPGFERIRRWGGSRVVFIGKAPQSRVEEVYSRFDILAALSIWPESYGLVTREARAYGLGVIASNRGDIGRGIGKEDGWVIDVSDGDQLRRLLLELNSNPEKGYIVPTAPLVETVRSSVDKLVTMLDQALT